MPDRAPTMKRPAWSVEMFAAVLVEPGGKAPLRAALRQLPGPRYAPPGALAVASPSAAADAHGGTHPV